MLHTESSDQRRHENGLPGDEYFIPETPRYWQGSVEQVLHLLEGVEAEPPALGTRVIVGERGGQYVPHTILLTEAMLSLSDHAIPDVTIEAKEGGRIMITKRQLKGAIEYLLAMRQAAKRSQS